jgi:hypothetical protein
MDAATALAGSFCAAYRSVPGERRRSERLRLRSAATGRVPAEVGFPVDLLGPIARGHRWAEQPARTQGTRGRRPGRPPVNAPACEKTPCAVVPPAYDSACATPAPAPANPRASWKPYLVVGQALLDVRLDARRGLHVRHGLEVGVAVRAVLRRRLAANAARGEPARLLLPPPWRHRRPRCRARPRHRRR